MTRPRRRWALAGALAAVVLVRVFVAVPFRIPTGSMLPTLAPGDFILVDKLSYRLGARPGRGDVVVFRHPREGDVSYVKRIVAAPGDRLAIRGGRLHVNGSPEEEVPARPGPVVLDVLGRYPGRRWGLFEAGPEGRRHGILRDLDGFLHAERREIELPEGSYFVMGDNRDFSHDSRFWGPLGEERIVGRALLVWLSATMPWSREGFAVRPGRVGQWIR